MFFRLGTFQIGAGIALLTIGARLLPAAEVALLSLARGRARAALGLARLLGAPEHGHARRRRRRDGCRVVQATGSDGSVREAERRRVPAADTG